MKKLFRLAFLIVAVVFAFRLGKGWEDTVSVPQNLIRSYIQTSSDTTVDQLKASVMDIVESFDCREEAETFLRANIEKLRIAVEEMLRQNK